MKEELKNEIIENLSDDLLKKEYLVNQNKNKYTGHCYVASECYYYLSQTKNAVYHIKHENTIHWYLKDIDNGEIIDLTCKQFLSPVPYEKGKRGFFLTNKPSQRTEILIKRIIDKRIKD